LSEIGENTIVILSTHIVEDVKELCTDMAIINQGEVLYKGSPIDAIQEVSGKIWKKRIAKAEIPSHKEKYHVISERLIAGTPEIRVLITEQPVASCEMVEADLEDVYFAHVFGTQEKESAVAV